MKEQTTVVGWAEKAPPTEHFVMASYGVTEPLQLFKTCRHGCCVNDGICDPMALPRYWRDATEQEKSMWPPDLRKALRAAQDEVAGKKTWSAA